MEHATTLYPVTLPLADGGGSGNPPSNPRPHPRTFSLSPSLSVSVWCTRPLRGIHACTTRRSLLNGPRSSLRELDVFRDVFRVFVAVFPSRLTQPSTFSALLVRDDQESESVEVQIKVSKQQTRRQAGHLCQLLPKIRACFRSMGFDLARVIDRTHVRVRAPFVGERKAPLSPLRFSRRFSGYLNDYAPTYLEEKRNGEKDRTERKTKRKRGKEKLGNYVDVYANEITAENYRKDREQACSRS